MDAQRGQVREAIKAETIYRDLDELAEVYHRIHSHSKTLASKLFGFADAIEPPKPASEEPKDPAHFDALHSRLNSLQRLGCRTSEILETMLARI